MYSSLLVMAQLSHHQIMLFNVELIDWIDLLMDRFPSNSYLSLFHKKIKDAMAIDSTTVYIKTQKFWLENKDVLSSRDLEKIKQFSAERIKATPDLADKLKKNVNGAIDLTHMFNELSTLAHQLNMKERAIVLGKLADIVNLANGN